MNAKILLALKDPTTTVPAIIIAIIQTLAAFGIVILPTGVQEAILSIALFAIMLFTGGIGQLKTTIPAVVYALFTVLQWLGVTLPPNSTVAVATLCVVIFGLFSGQPIDPKTLPAVDAEGNLVKVDAGTSSGV